MSTPADTISSTEPNIPERKPEWGEGGSSSIHINTSPREILLILLSMEPDQITGQHALDQLISHRQRPPEIRSRKWRVQREPNHALPTQLP